MFENWREAIHIGEWTGLSIGAAIGLGALAWYVAPLRKIAIVGGLVVAAGYAGTLHGAASDHADMLKQIDQQRAAALEEQTKRDTRVEQELEAKYQPKLKELRQQSDARKKQVDDYEGKILSLWTARAATPADKTVVKAAPAAAVRCELGAAALKLRGK